MEASTIHQAVFALAETYAGRVAVEDAGRSITYAELGRSVRTAAGAFIARGVGRGDRVAIWAPNSLEWIIATLGLQAAGAILVPLNTRFRAAEAADILRRSGAKILLTVSAFLGNRYLDMLKDQDLPELQHRVAFDASDATGWRCFLDTQVDAAAVDARMASVSGDDISDIIFTSGTTGQPKGAMTTHAQNLRMYDNYSRCFGARPGDRYLIINPFFHTFGYKAGWLSAFLRGATVLPHPIFDTADVMKRIGADKISVLQGPPTLYQSLLALPDFAAYDISTLRLAITGSSTIPPELIRRMRRELGFERVFTAYGLSETGGVVTMTDADDTEETIALTSGRAVEGITVRIADNAGRAVAPGTAGEVLVGGYCIMKGYFNDEAATREAVDADGWLHTGDIGVLRTDGCLSITGRKKDMFIVGGFNCYPAEVENILHNHPAISQAAVIGVPDDRMGEVGKAFVVLKPGHTLDAEALLRWSRDNMANYKVPRFITFRQSLPTSAAGKIQKDVLRDLDAAEKR